MISVDKSINRTMIPHTALLLFLLCLIRATRFTTSLSLTNSPSSGARASSPHRILVLGGSGFVGQEIIRQLEQLNIPHTVASRSTNGLDLTAPDAANKVAACAQGCTAVITTVGSLMGNAQDEVINAANGEAAEGASQVPSVQRFVAIGNDPKVRKFSQSIPFLQSYTKGKETAEAKIEFFFPGKYTIIQPSLIHGGDSFSASPPRIPSVAGQVAEDILGLYPFQAASEALPGVFGVALQAPLSRERVARAAINAALGLTGAGRLNSREAIIFAASKRPAKELFECAVDEPVTQLKQQLQALGDCQGDPDKLKIAFELLEKIENCNGYNPSIDPLLNGRWDFCFDVEADMGTGVVKDILEGKSPIQPLFDLQDLHMEIDNNHDIKINVNLKVLNVPMPVQLTTSIEADPTDPRGTTFLEYFQGLQVAGQRIPIPAEWQRARPLEFSYLDETMLIARGNGGEPHYLKRGNSS